MSFKTNHQPAPVSVAEVIAKMLEDMGVQYAFGVSGGAIGSATAPWAIAVRGACALRSGGSFRIARLYHALQHSDIRVLHIHDEAGAAFAATEAYFASGCRVVAFTTTSLGITNALTTQMFLHRDRYLTMLLLEKCSDQLQ